jgi:predicted ribosomally synthesized peptide with nif11-like leader
MSLENIMKFRELANADASLRPRYLQAIGEGPSALAAMANQSGFDCNDAEMSDAVRAISTSGDLTDVELELVSGGGDTGCQNGLLVGQRQDAKDNN